jgi:branched-chain amino acid transport system substrate-binding protein
LRFSLEARTVRRALVLALVASGCSYLTRTDACTANSDCRAAFGPGMLCQSGLCAPAPANPRCSPEPSDLLSNPQPYRDVVVLGSMVDRSTQQLREDSVRLVQDQLIELAGTASDVPFYGVVYCDIESGFQGDTRPTTQIAPEVAEYLAGSVGVAAIVGPSGSDNAYAAAQVALGEKTLLISPSATSPVLRALNPSSMSATQPGLFWRTAPSDEFQGQAIGRYLSSVAPKKVAIVYQGGLYGNKLAQVTNDSFSGSTPDWITFDTSDAALMDAAQRASSGGYEQVVFISSYVDRAAFFLQHLAPDPNGALHLFFTDAAASKTLVMSATAALLDGHRWQRLLGTRQSVQHGSQYAAFSADYTRSFGSSPDADPYVPHFYDATWLVAFGVGAALVAGQRPTGESIARGLWRMSPTGTPVGVGPTDWPDVIQTFTSGGSIEVAGASGPLDYDANQELLHATIEYWSVTCDAGAGTCAAPATASMPNAISF